VVVEKEVLDAEIQAAKKPPVRARKAAGNGKAIRHGGRRRASGFAAGL